MVYIPGGFAHGFALEDSIFSINARIEGYNKESEGGIIGMIH
jgi:dTDP-4-dehydrorhamnose 3,5-epimerase-like enzyme